MNTDNSQSQAPLEQSPEQLKKNRLQLIAILAIVLIPVLGSTFMFYTGIGMPQGTSNHGVLIEPPMGLTDIAVSNNDGSPWSWAESGKFRFITLLDGQCDETCNQMLYITRQVHVRLAKRGGSLERLLVQLDDAITETPLPTSIGKSMAEEYPGLAQMRSDFYQWRERLSNQASLSNTFNGHQILLVDRRGNLIMAFDQNNSGEDIHKDLNFLIKSTQ